MKKYALVLEGGGARGAYQIGAYKALKEEGYEFKAVIGTSIGAINAALIVQGDEEKLEELWRNLSFGDLINVDNNKVQDLIVNKNITKDNLSEITKVTTDALKSLGINTDKERELLERYVDEGKIRKSKIRFGLVTFNLSDFKAEKLFIEDIPKGKLVDYLMASSNLPIFKRAKIEDKNYLDGGAVDNCSVEMLYDAGYKNIVAVRLFLRNRIRKYYSLKKNEDLNLEMIVPSENLPYILNFETSSLNNIIDYGYVDTIKQIEKLNGTYYAIEKVSKNIIENSVNQIKPFDALEIVKYANIKLNVGENVKDILISKAIPKIERNTFVKKKAHLYEQILDIIEFVASNEKISKNEIYTYDKLLKMVKEKINYIDANNLSQIEKAAYTLIQKI